MGSSFRAGVRGQSDQVAPHLRSCIAVVGEPNCSICRSGSGARVARYFIIVGGTLAALLFIAGRCLPTPPAMFAIS